MEEERRESLCSVFTGFSPAVIKASHGIAARRDDNSVQKIVFSFAGKLQKALGQTANEWPEIGIADVHFFSADPPQTVGENTCRKENLIRDIGAGIADNATATGFPVPDMLVVECR